MHVFSYVEKKNFVRKTQSAFFVWEIDFTLHMICDNNVLDTHIIEQ